jgi:two-component system, OmpR family, KDP operon response regulator KdpE
MNKSGNVVLIIEDEPKIRRFLRIGFEMKGYSVFEAENGAEGVKIATSNSPDLIILDLVLSDLPGTEVLERIRLSSNAPVIVVSAISSVDEKIRLLQAGADDYLVKPFSMPELVERGSATLRRYFKSPTDSSVMRAGPLSIDFVSRAVALNNNPVTLTRKEYRLLHILAMHVGLPVSHEHLLAKIWNGSRSGIQHLRILVRNLREKIEADPDNPQLLITDSGIGYRLQNPRETSPSRENQALPEPGS